MNKTQTRKANTQAQAFDAQAEVMALREDFAELTALLRGLVASETVTVPNTKGKKQSAKAITDKKAKHSARVEVITAKKDAWADFTIEQAIQHARAEIRANRKTNTRNVRIEQTSPDSPRVFLSSATNQALRSVRQRLELRYTDVENMLNASK